MVGLFGYRNLNTFRELIITYYWIYLYVHITDWYSVFISVVKPLHLSYLALVARVFQKYLASITVVF